MLSQEATDLTEGLRKERDLPQGCLAMPAVWHTENCQKFYANVSELGSSCLQELQCQLLVITNCQ